MSAAAQVDISQEAEPGSRRLDPFRILSDAERRQQLDGYLAFLHERDGEMDFPGRTLSRREAYIRELASERVEWTGEVATDDFYQHLHRAGKPAMDPRTTWLVAAARANQMESYGVEHEVAKWMRRGYTDRDEIVLYDVLEEQYHSRILIEICRTGGLGGVRLTRPDWFMRALTQIMNHFPDAMRYVPISCGEILGCTIFQTLLDNCHLFAEQPAVEARLRSLLSEVLLDEKGHVLYCRAHMSPTTLRIAQFMIPWVSAQILRDVPQLHRLGLDQQELSRRIRSGIEIPPEYDWLEGDPLS